MMERVEMFGCPFDRVDLDAAVQQAEAYIDRGDRLYQSVGVNLDQLLKMQRDPGFAGIITRCDQITADGQPVVWISRLLGEPLPARVPSVDIMEALLPRAAERGDGVFLLGARRHSVEQAAVAFRRRWPGLHITGVQDGYFSVDEEPDIVRRINEVGTDILFIAISSPKKEEFVERNREALQARYVLGVGSAFDIAAGLTRRAPRWMCRTGLEWAWRVWQEPRRMGPRVLDDLAFAPYVMSEFFRRRCQRPR